ncbi:hypothetical protein [Chitinophaga sp.]|uniref:hypothetical protein n=1 Tax=Chitinophaga sp. TaxID=1869181 RepID=UPI002624E972|nr:hypothetical protein [uncultured Chitinophaga sp.]
MGKNLPHRVVITTKDIQLILGKGERSARDLMQKLRAYFQKKPGQYVSVAEFCAFVGIAPSDVKEFF